MDGQLLADLRAASTPRSEDLAHRIAEIIPSYRVAIAGGYLLIATWAVTWWLGRFDLRTMEDWLVGAVAGVILGPIVIAIFGLIATVWWWRGREIDRRCALGRDGRLFAGRASLVSSPRLRSFGVEFEVDGAKLCAIKPTIGGPQIAAGAGTPVTVLYRTGASWVVCFVPAGEPWAARVTHPQHLAEARVIADHRGTGLPSGPTSSHVDE